MKKNLETWGTEQEIMFLDNVGKPTEHNNTKCVKEDDQKQRDRYVCLVGYLEAAPMRDDWANIDKTTAISRCKMLLETEYGVVI